MQATELCGEKAANLQTTFIHLQWQSKHVEQRLMVERASREISNATIAAAATTLATVDDNGGEEPLRGVATAPAASSSAGTSAAVTTDKSVCQGTRDRRKRAGSESALAAATAATTLAPCPRGGPDRLEVLRLEAKGQELARAMVVVEGVLNKMEEQARIPGRPSPLKSCSFVVLGGKRLGNSVGWCLHLSRA